MTMNGGNIATTKDKKQKNNQDKKDQNEDEVKDAK